MLSLRWVSGAVGIGLLTLAIVAAGNAGAVVLLAAGGGAGLAGAVLDDSHPILRWTAMGVAAAVVLMLLLLAYALSEGID